MGGDVADLRGVPGEGAGEAQPDGRVSAHHSERELEEPDSARSLQDAEEIQEVRPDLDSERSCTVWDWEGFGLTVKGVL